jgi:hypothetical protein
VFYVVCNSRHFVALIVMINSLRESGHSEPVYVTDCGLTHSQCALLETNGITLLQPNAMASPPMLKMHGPAIVGTELSVILDADVIIRRPFFDVLDGRPVFFENDVPRYHEGWSALGYAERHRPPYVCSGHFVITRDLIDTYQVGIDRMIDLTTENPNLYRTPSDPFYLPEQDVLNAMLGSLDPTSYRVLDEVAYWPFKRNVDTARLWHHIQAKPWLAPRPQTVFTREMIRLVHEGAIRIPNEEIPLPLRRGAAGTAVRAMYSARYRGRNLVRGRLGIRRRLGHPSASRHFSGMPPK